MKKKSESVLSARLKQKELERKKLAERVLANIKEMNEKQKAWVRQRFRQHEGEK
jgi:Asp-tRNA(Asn)/Glu-tRNA(Gln) amidotransferase A subunit family amidase